MNRFLKSTTVWVALLALSVMNTSAFASESREWLFDIRYDIAGITETYPVYHHAQCLTDAVPMPDIANSGQHCSSRMHGRFGNTLTWQIDCSSEWEMVQGVGRVTFDKGNAGGIVHVQILSPFNGPQYMVFHIEGKAGGSCGQRNSSRPITAETASIHTTAGPAGRSNSADAIRPSK